MREWVCRETVSADGLQFEVDIGVASMGNFVLAEACTKKELPSLQLFVRRGGIEGSQFLDGVCFYFFFRVLMPECDIGDAVRPQEGYDSRHAVRDSAVILSFFLLRYHECGQVTLVDLVKIFFGASLAEFVQD